MANAATLDTIVSKLPVDIQPSMREFALWLQEDLRVSHKDFSELKETVQRLASLQELTEQRINDLTVQVEHLADAQERTEEEIRELRKSLSNQIAALGSRWGIYNEGTFRSTIYRVFKEMEGVTVKEGDYVGRQVDIVIRDGEHILLEITSRMHSKDIDRLYRSADDYEQQEGVKPKLMVATSYISPKLMQKIMGLPRPIEIFSYEGEE